VRAARYDKIKRTIPANGNCDRREWETLEQTITRKPYDAQ